MFTVAVLILRYGQLEIKSVLEQDVVIRTFHRRRLSGSTPPSTTPSFHAGPAKTLRHRSRGSRVAQCFQGGIGCARLKGIDTGYNLAEHGKSLVAVFVNGSRGESSGVFRITFRDGTS
jgi:hypothetical protein